MCCRLEELNEKIDNMVQRGKVAEKEEVGYVIYETCCLRKSMRIFLETLYVVSMHPWKQQGLYFYTQKCVS